MADKHAVTELLNHAGVAYDTADTDFLREMFVDDGAQFEMTIAGGDVIPFEGKATIGKLFADSLEEQTDQRRHVITNIYFTDEAADSITAISYLVLIAVENGALNVLSTGIYTDSCVLQGSDWKLKKRRLDLDLPY
jgi:hypothetical protein